MNLKYQNDLHFEMEEVAMCGCNGEVKLFLNPWGLSQLSIQLILPVQTSFPGKRYPTLYTVSASDSCSSVRHVNIYLWQ